MTYERETIVLHSLTPDLIPQDAPAEAWNNGENVLFRNMETIAANRDRAILPQITAPPRAMAYVEPFDVGYWVIATNDNIWAHDGAAVHDITPDGWAGSSDGAIFTGTVINGLAVINSSERDPVWWDGVTSNKMQALPDWPAGGRCLAMRAHKNNLFAIGMVSENGARVRWSDSAEAGVIPPEWSPLASNDAGFQDLAPEHTECLDGLTLRDDFLVYKRGSVYSFTFTGGPEIYAIRKTISNVGVAETNALTRGPDESHLFIGSDGDVHLSDGVQVRSVLDGRAQRGFYAVLSDTRGATYAAATLLREKLGVIAYPTGDSTKADKAILYDFATGDIGFRELPGVRCFGHGRMLEDVGQADDWDSDGDPWDVDLSAWNVEFTPVTTEDVLLGSSTDNTMLFFGADVAYPVSVEKQGLAFGNPQTHKLAVRVWPKIEGHTGDVVTFRIGAQEQQGAPVRLSPPVDYVIGDPRPLDVFAAGRFLSFHVLSSDTSVWRLGSIDVEYRELGGW